MFYEKLVGLFILLSEAPDTGAQRMGMTQELLASVTGITDYVKVLVRIALIGALGLGRQHGFSEALESFLDKIHMLAVRKGSPSARRAVAGAKDVVPLSMRSGSINTSTYGVVYGFRSLAPEFAGASPLHETSYDLTISNVSVPSTPSDSCVACGLTVKEDCVRLGTYQRWHPKCIRCKICGIDASPTATADAEDKSRTGAGDGIVGPAVSTAWGPSANVDHFVWSPDVITNTQSFGEVPTAIYCRDHAWPGCRRGFKAVSCLEQYAFLLNVALRWLHVLLTKRNVITSMPTSTCCVFPTTASAIILPSATFADLNSLPSGETDSNPKPRKAMLLKSFHPERKLRAIGHITKPSTIVESPSTLLHSTHTKYLTPIANGSTVTTAITTSYQSLNHLTPLPALPPSSLPSVDEAAHSSDATVSNGNPPPEPTPSDIPHPGEAENGVEQRRSLPRRSIDVQKLSKLAVKQRRPVPLVPTDKGFTLADTQPLKGWPSTERHRSTPPLNLTPYVPYVAELTPLELAIVRHAAVAVLYRSSLRDEMDLAQILEILEVKRPNLSERPSKPANNWKKEGTLIHRLVRLVGLILGWTAGRPLRGAVGASRRARWRRLVTWCIKSHTQSAVLY